MYYVNLFGLFISITAFILAYRIPHSIPVTIKQYLVIITSIIIFLTVLNIISPTFFNKYARYLLMINILVIIYIEQKNIYLAILLLLIGITTPDLKYENNEIVMYDKYIDYKLWIISSSIILGYIYITNDWINIVDKRCNTKDYKLGYHLLLSLIIPFITFVIFNKWLEIRGIILCVFILYEYNLCNL